MVRGDAHPVETRGEATEFAGALLASLVRALRLDRAALLVEQAPGGPFVPAATHGRVGVRVLAPGVEPGDGPWSAVVPLQIGPRTAGVVLLDRNGDGPLSPGDRRLAERLDDVAARLVDAQRVAAELAHSRDLLARADRLSALGTLAAGVAHEIRNPLVSVRTFIQLLPERLADEEFRTAFRELALAEIERICGLINDLLAFSRPTPAQRDPADLNELVGQIVRLLDAEARKHDVTVTHHASPVLPAAVVDDAQIKQVVMNVVLNAIEATGRGGRVDVVTRSETVGGEEWCVIEVADSGPGIDPETLRRIFEPFFTTKETGSGLGLFIAHRIVAQHGGRLVATARDTGGAVFAVHLPVRARVRDVPAA